MSYNRTYVLFYSCGGRCGSMMTQLAERLVQGQPEKQSPVAERAAHLTGFSLVWPGDRRRAFKLGRGHSLL